MIWIILASVGMLCGIAGSILHGTEGEKWLFLANAVLMTPLPLARKDHMLSALQFVSLAGAVTGVASLADWISTALPLAAAAIACAWLRRFGAFSEANNITGAAGIAALALGYAIQHPGVYLVGGILLAVFTGVAFFKKKNRIAILWFILNLAFVAASAVAVIERYSG